MSFRLGTRTSALARWQAEWVAARLRENGVDVELVLVTTMGDRQSAPIEIIGGTGVFTKEIQRALLDGRIDLAVHSLKDLPTAATPGIVLAAVPQRGPVGDMLVLGPECSGSRPRISDLSSLPSNAIIGTGSLRRRTQLLHLRRDLTMKDIRGNVETRLRKLERGEYDALILAEAGLHRLGFLTNERTVDNKDSRPLYFLFYLEWMVPAVGQGALALECRDDDHATREILAKINHPPTHMAVLAERAMLAMLQGGCLAPIAALGRVEQSQLTLTGRVLSLDGVEQLDAEHAAILPSPNGKGDGGEDTCAIQLGRQVAESLLAQGAERLIQTARIHQNRR